MLFLRKPSRHDIDKFIAAQSKLDFAYPNVGRLIETRPAGHAFHSADSELGHDEAVFQSAVAALHRWEQFRVGWVELCWPKAPIQIGTTVAILARTFGLWSLSACRIIQLLEEYPSADTRQFGFVYATLPDHPEIGEERFAVQWCQETDQVKYEIAACFRPRDVIVRLAWLYFRRMLDQFRRQSAASMKLACSAPLEAKGVSVRSSDDPDCS